MVSRRNAIAGIGGLAIGCCSARCLAQWPQGATGESRKFNGDGGGCQGRSGLINGSLNVQPFFEADQRLVSAFIAQGNALDRYFATKSSQFVYDDSGAPNALALPYSIDTASNRDQDGSILVGKKLMQQAAGSGSRILDTGFFIIVAHEHAHIHQYKIGLGLPTLKLELHADFLAGWVIGREVKKGNYTTSVEDGARELFRLGSTDFTSPTFHGTPEQRLRASKAGSQVAMSQSSDDLSAATAEATSFVANLERALLRRPADSGGKILSPSSARATSPASPAPAGRRRTATGSSARALARSAPAPARR